MKIKTTITESRQVEKEIEVPYYCKDLNTKQYFAVGEEKVIRVFVGINYNSVVVALARGWAEEISKSIPSTEHEFISEYTKAWVAIEEGREELERLSIINSIPI